MLKSIQTLFYCPQCHNDLEWSIQTETENRIIEAEVSCSECDTHYFVKDGIAVFLLDVSNDADFWRVVQSNLAKALDTNSEYEEKLMQSDLSTLNPADKFLRSMILDERGDYDRAEEIRSEVEIYTDSYNLAYQKKKAQLKKLLSDKSDVIIDIASGMGGFAEMFSQLDNPVILSDISPSILQRNKERLEHFGLYDKVSLIAFDAKKMPFKDRSIGVFTTNLGLTNITQSEEFLKELKRCLNGVAYFLTYFFPDNEDENAEILEEYELEFGFKNRLEDMSASFFETSILFEEDSFIEPTASSEIFEIKIDALPAIPTHVTWAIVQFSPMNNDR
ncbi:MAG: methyltransferase domain-containing protein [Candidatus Lokiarchaeota archaeon]|nr:methyltransferase domain-containing protein [Candidatus Lokiarchaeota archaeon]